MADHRYRRWGQDPLRSQAQAAAQAIIAQSRASAPRGEPRPAPELEVREEPMNRYIHVYTRPTAAPSACAGPARDTALLERLLEASTQQNQLLIDLLSAVNGLTAAVLGIQARLRDLGG